MTSWRLEMPWTRHHWHSTISKTCWKHGCLYLLAPNKEMPALFFWIIDTCSFISGVVMLTVMVCCFLIFVVQKGDENVLNTSRRRWVWCLKHALIMRTSFIYMWPLFSPSKTSATPGVNVANATVDGQLAAGQIVFGRLFIKSRLLLYFLITILHLF